MGLAQKKVVVRETGGRVAWGYLPASGFLRWEEGGGWIDLMGLDGRVMTIDFNEIEMIATVRDFNLDDPVNPERLGRRSFPARPRGDGLLWLRMAFREEPALEGVVNFDAGWLDGLLEDRGIWFVPPDLRGNTLRVFVPRHALRSLEVLGWVSSPTKKLAEKTARQIELAVQAGLFEGRE
jgi:hypothetical protein